MRSLRGALNIRVGMCIAYDEGRPNHAAANHFLHEKRTERLRRFATGIACGKDKIAGAAQEFKVPIEVKLMNGTVDLLSQKFALPPKNVDYVPARHKCA